MEIKYRMEIARKSLGFIDDKDLQAVIIKRLDELERVFSVNANLSTIILSISTMRKYFRHIASIFKTAIKASPKYPEIKPGKKKKFDDLTIEEIYKLLFEEISYNVLRALTKFILYSVTIAISFTRRRSRKNLGQLGLDKRKWP